MKSSLLSVSAGFMSMILAGQVQAANAVVQPQPKTLTVNAGSTAAFTVSVNDALSFQWQFKGTNLPGATNSSFTIENVATNQSGAYRVVVGTSNGTVTSQPSSLSVVQGTIVRFHLAPGDVDVELFDHDKPATVQNFLHYVVAGIYSSNAFVSRVVPNFVLQGGGFATLDQSTNLFIPSETTNLFLKAYNNTNDSFAWRVDNEFNVGPRVRNTFGTIAMARVPGVTNSANSQWFFNLSDNSTNLDNQEGGFTVFGRVIQGDNTLNYFNNISSDNIIDLSTYYPTNGGSNFVTLPYMDNGGGLPRNSDLYYTPVTLVTKKPVIDLTAPKIAITYPPANASLTNGNITLRGTASDNSGVGMVYCFIQKQYYFFGFLFYQTILSQSLPGTTNWSLPLNLPPGNYLTIVETWDGHGNIKWTQRPFFVTSPLTVNVEGNGKVSPNLSGRYLKTYNHYNLTAVPGVGQMFATWTTTNGSVVSLDSKLNFLMTPNLILNARFIPNFFPSVKGTYNGLFYQSNTVTSETAGFFSLTTIGSAGVYNGNLFLAGNTLKFSGKFDYLGTSKISIKQPGSTNPIILSLALDLTNNTDTISGTVSNSNSSWTSSLFGYRGVAKLTSTNYPAPGKYGLIVSGDAFATNGGNGFAAVSASGAGSLTYSGALADNSAFNRTVVVSKEGYWPVYAPLSGSAGVLIGWEQFTNSTQCLGTLNWIKPSSGSKTNGITVSANGQNYVAPTAGTSYKITFSGANLSTPVTFNLGVNAVRQFTAPGIPATQIKITFVPASGVFTGQFASSSSDKMLTFKGIFINPAQGGTGFFIDDNGNTGACELLLQN